MTAFTMHYFVTKPLLQRHCSRLWLLMIAGCTLLSLLDRGQASAVAQTVSAADFSVPNLAAAPTNSVTQTVLLVNPTMGNDAVADGSDRAPFKTIAQALQVAQPGSTILLSPGTYSQETGETFPLRLKPDVTLQGNAETRGQGIVIQGSGFFLSPTFARQKVAIVGADRAILSGVTVKNPDAQGYGVWIESTSPAILDSTFTESGHDGISVTGSGSPLIRNNYFYQNGANGITIYGTSRADVRENIFEQTGFAINVNQKAAPLLIGNRITQNKDGIVVQAGAQPIVRDNSVDGNTRDGLVAIAQSRPNLGTATAPGGNSFRNNGQFDVNAKGLHQPIPAFGNDWHKTIGTLDLTGTSPEVAAASGTPMPWSLSAIPRSLVNADKSISADGKNAASPVQKRATGKPSIAATNQVAATIPFGQRLVSDRSVGTAAQTAPRILPLPSATVTNTPASDGISAASFPVPVVQPVKSLNRPIAPMVAIALPPSASSEPAFPVPSALFGRQTQSPPRAIQIVSVAVAPPTPRQRVSPPAQRPNANLPPAVLTPRPVVYQDSTPITVAYTPRPLTVHQSLLPTPKPRVPMQTRSIAIPVPEPEARSAPSPMPVRSTVINLATSPGTLASAGLLPVPNPNAPIGIVGSLSNVYHSQQSASNTFASSRAALGLRYRVVVEADDSQQAQLRATFPNAFRTSIKGRSLIQVGAFGNRAKADQLMQTLNSQGVQAAVETLE